MKKLFNRAETAFGQFLVRHGIGMRAKLVIMFLVMQVLPLLLLTIFAWHQINTLGELLREIAVEDASEALNASAVENIERMTTDTAHEVADFLYARDADLLYLASLEPNEEAYRQFAEGATGRLMERGEWSLAADGESWVRLDAPTGEADPEAGKSTNSENNDRDGFRHRQPEDFAYFNAPLYDEITYVDLSGQEVIKVVTRSTKTNHPMNPALLDVSKRENTFVKAETYFEQLQSMRPGQIYVSDVIGAYTPSNYIGMYTPSKVAAAAQDRGYAIEYDPQAQSYAGQENPNGQRFEGIVRWATPVANSQGEITGYVTFALNHDHIMEFVDHQTPMNERYTTLPSAYDGNYAFIWDYQCRSICHPRHNSIVGYDPATGQPEVPWLETEVYNAWQQSGVDSWYDFVMAENWPWFDGQSREKKPAPALTQAGLVGLDGRFLNNAPQCTGWMDLTKDGGSGSFYILWSGLYKLTTAAAIPYYTGQYAPGPANDYSERGFGIVTIGAGLEDFTQPATDMQLRLTGAVEENLGSTAFQLAVTSTVLIVLVVLIAFLLATQLTGSITRLISGISRFRAGERQFRFDAPVKDEFGTLADSFDDMADGIEESVKNPLSIIDMDHKVIYMNQQGLEVCGATLEEAVGASYDDLSIYPANTAFSPLVALQEGREAEVFFEQEHQRYLKGIANYFTNKDGQNQGYIIETIDVTELRQVQLDLEKAIKDAELASAHKGDFLARMSHEIRTPLNAIIGVAGIIQKRLAQRGDDSPAMQEVQGHVNQIETSSQHLLGLLNDILDVSKIEAGKIDLVMEPMSLAQLGETVSGIIRSRCGEKNIAYTTQFDDFGGVLFESDALRLRQVLINLLGNAVKFTPQNGSINFAIQKLQERDEEMLVRFSVKDNGIGVDEEAAKTIFEPFEQGDRKVSQQHGGTGLGLSISKSIVEMLGGELVLDSTLGAGSEFYFAVWMRKVDGTLQNIVADAEIGRRFAGKHLLLVDDVEINRMIVVALLEDTGIFIDEAGDGTQALEMFDASAPYSYDMILMDIQMPGMNGYETALAIRALNRPDAESVPIVALTANAFKEDIDKAMRHKMNAHVSKPVELQALAEVLVRLWGEGTQP